MAGRPPWVFYGFWIIVVVVGNVVGWWAVWEFIVNR